MAMTSMRLRRLQRTFGAAMIAVLLLPAAAAAEEASDTETDATAPAEESIAAEEASPEPEPGPESEPAPEPAPDEVGGWAVIDPVTGDVKNVIVCTESVCGATGEWGGVLPGDTSCAGCLLRKQTNGTSDGNVAGWRSSEGMAVTYDGDEDGTFTIVSGGSTGSGDSVEQRMILDPSQTATDPDGMDLHTGIVKRSTTGRFTEGEQTAQATVDEQRPEGGALDSDRVVVEFDEWGQDFTYGSAAEAAASLEADVDAALGIEADESDEGEGEFAAETEKQSADEPSDEAASSPADNPVVRAIQTITRRIVTFLSSWFGG